MILKFNRVLGVVEIHVHAKFNQAKCSSSWVINSALDFGQLWTLIANISGTAQAIDKRKTALSTTIFSMFDENNLANFGPLTKRWIWPMTLKYNMVLVVVEDWRYMFTQNFIKLSSPVHELSCPQSFFALSRNGKESENPVLWPWNSIGFMRLSRYMFVQNLIELSAAVHELS